MAGIPTDKEELGSDNAEQELTLTLLRSDEEILDQIEAALQWIEDGGYGRCEKFGEHMPKSRLDAIMPQIACDVRRNRKKCSPRLNNPQP